MGHCACGGKGFYQVNDQPFCERCKSSAVAAQTRLMIKRDQSRSQFERDKKRADNYDLNTNALRNLRSRPPVK